MTSSLKGFYDKANDVGGPITGSGPNFKEAILKFNERVAKFKEVGSWRKGPCDWKKNIGTYVDPDYYLVNYGNE